MVVTLFALWIALNHQTLKDYFTARNHRDKNIQAVDRLKAEKTKLEHELQQLQSIDISTGRIDYAVEKTIREDHNFRAPGETIIRLERNSIDKSNPDRNR